MALERLVQNLRELNIPYEDVTSEEDVEFRMIDYHSNLFTHPYFIKLEFPERAGALHDFLTSIKGIANMCYFNYVYTGEQVGRALIGFEFESEAQQANFKNILGKSETDYHEISAETLKRIL